MKYIATKLPSGQEQMFVFDTDIMHVNFFETIKLIKTYDETGAWQRKHAMAVCVGAGFVHKGVCKGRSESLGISSRGQVDTALLRMLP